MVISMRRRYVLVPHLLKHDGFVSAVRKKLAAISLPYLMRGARRYPDFPAGPLQVVVEHPLSDPLPAIHEKVFTGGVRPLYPLQDFLRLCRNNDIPQPAVRFGEILYCRYPSSKLLVLIDDLRPAYPQTISR